jgi:hypothetical protein
VEALGPITIPLFSGAIGYLTNWSGIWMLFQPLRFKGVRIPGLATLAGVLPRKIQEIPGIMHGGVGWQGIIPSRAAKMGSIAVDKGIAKLGSPSDFYEQLDPELIAEHIVASSQGDLHELVERTMEREHPALWRDLPPRVRAGIHERVQRQLPDIVRDITRQIGENINQLLDVKLMVIRHMDERPELCNRIFTEVGARELRPPRPDLVLARAAGGSAALPGARGPAGGARVHALRRTRGQDRAQADPPDAVRARLLPRLPALAAQRLGDGGDMHARGALGVLAVAIPVQAVGAQQEPDAVLGQVRDAGDDLDRGDRVERDPRRELMAARGDVAGERQIAEPVANHPQAGRGRESPSGTHSFVTRVPETRQTVES